MSESKVNFVYSAVVAKDGKPHVFVSFEQDKKCAEGSVPECRITKNKGFSPDEVSQLEQYLKENKKNIIENAKKITGIKHWFGDSSI